MKKHPDSDTIVFTLELLEKLKKDGYNFMVCTPVNLDKMLKSEEDQNNLTILFTPISEIMEGFKLLKNLNKESFLLTFDEVEEELSLTKEPYLNFLINKVLI